MTRGRFRPRSADIIACAVIAVFGAAALLVGLDYRIGGIQRMGPGFFPVATSIAIILLALASAAEALAAAPVRRDLQWRPLIFISLGVIAWALLIDRAGLAPATFAMILIASLAKAPFRPVALLLLATAICAAGYLIFIAGLHMPLTLIGR
ncbi:MAG: tripartite tricarboxylate transporter TctB family protein [Alphaproteobacteria bacterium]